MIPVGFIGLGAMGAPIARKLQEAGYPLNVWGRRPEPLQPFADNGATVCDSPSAVAAASEIVFLCVTDTDAVEAVVFGPQGLAEGGSADTVLIDHSSIRPDATRTFADRLKAACGMAWIDAPVSGGGPGVENKTLVVMAGGDAAAFKRAYPVVMSFAGRCTLMGPSGAGQATKLINQTLAGVNFALLAEATQLALDAGIDAARIPEALAGGRADSAILQEYMPRMVERTFNPMGSIALMLKDLETAAGLAREHGTTMPLTALAIELHRLRVAAGQSGEDNAAMIRLYDRRESPR